MTTTAIFAGSFDPFHRGHVAIASAAARGFGRLVVAVTTNPDKPTGLLTADERVAVAAASTAHLGNVTVVVHHGLVADLARELGADAFVRSIGKEQALELQMAVHNEQLASIPTVFFPPAVATGSISASQIRSLIARRELVAAADLVSPLARRSFLAAVTGAAITPIAPIEHVGSGLREPPPEAWCDAPSTALGDL